MEKVKIELTFSEDEMIEFLKKKGGYMIGNKNENGELTVTYLHSYQVSNMNMLLKDAFTSELKHSVLYR